MQVAMVRIFGCFLGLCSRVVGDTSSEGFLVLSVCHLGVCARSSIQATTVLTAPVEDGEPSV